MKSFFPTLFPWLKFQNPENGMETMKVDRYMLSVYMDTGLFVFFGVFGLFPRKEWEGGKSYTTLTQS